MEQLFEKRYTKKGVRAFVKETEQGDLDLHFQFQWGDGDFNPMLGGGLFEDRLDDLYKETGVLTSWNAIGSSNLNVDDSADWLAKGYREVIL